MSSHNRMFDTGNRFQKKYHRNLRYLITVFAPIFIFLIFMVFRTNILDALIEIDMNSSIEVALNKKQKVLRVTLRNDYLYHLEAKTESNDNTELENQLTSIQWKGKSLHEVSRIVIGALSPNDHIILISVMDGKPTQEQKIRTLICQETQDALLKNQKSALVMYQSITGTKDLQSLANKYDISIGKITFIHKLIQKDSSLRYEHLAPLPLRDILMIANIHEIDLSQIVDEVLVVK